MRTVSKSLSDMAFRSYFNLYDAHPRVAIPKSAMNLTKPTLLLTASQDPIGTPGRAELGTRPYAPDFRVQEIDSGHFLMLEKADEVNEALREFFEG